MTIKSQQHQANVVPKLYVYDKYGFICAYGVAFVTRVKNPDRNATAPGLQQRIVIVPQPQIVPQKHVSIL